MDETTIVSTNPGVARATAPAWVGAWSGISWSAVIAGAITAVAVSVIIISLGTGIGMVVVSPYSYSSPSAETMTIIGALWLVFAQAVGFATGGYVAGRLRRPPAAPHDDEVKFRDGANGLLVWAVGVVITSLVVAGAVEKMTAAAGTTMAGVAIAGGAGAASQSQSMAYFTDVLLRPNPQSAPGATAGGNTPGAAANATPENPPAQNNQNNNANAAGQRGQVNRILLMSLGPNGISKEDRTYLAQLVSAQTGISQDDAQKRVDDVISRAKLDAKNAADTARKGAAYLSFWTFMSLLFGAVCATLGGILGGDLRDEFAMRGVMTAPR